jgi:hypothetical protein
MHVNDAILDRLYDLGYVGPFPEGITLLVPLETAVQEINFEFKTTFTRSTLKTMLSEEDVLIFNSLEDYARFKGLETKKKRR